MTEVPEYPARMGLGPDGPCWRLVPLSVWVGLGIVVLAMGSAGCDFAAEMEPASDRPGPGEVDSLHIGLLESGRVVTGLSDDEGLQVETLAPLQATAKASAALEEARHACTISLYRPDGPRGPGYYYRSARLAYPDSVLQQAGGETVHLTARLSGPIVPHPSKTSSLLRCRLPAVEGAERRVRTFFRASPKQLKASGFERVDSLKRRGTGSPKASGLSKSDCWRERTCIRAEDGSLQNCTDWEYSPCTGGGGSVSFGGGMGELPSGGDQTIYGTRTIDPGGIDGGFGDSGPDPEINPCESADPPEYCDAAGSCFDADIADSNDEAVIEDLEDKGILSELWKKSNADASDQSEREERGGWIVQEDDGSYGLVEFHEVQSDVKYTPIGVRNVSTGARPSGTVGTLHPHPFEAEETITDAEVVGQYLIETDRDPTSYDIEKIANPSVGQVLQYPTQPSPGDFASAADTRLRGYLIDGSGVFSFSGYDANGNGQLEESEGSLDSYRRCGY